MISEFTTSIVSSDISVKKNKSANNAQLFTSISQNKSFTLLITKLCMHINRGYILISEECKFNLSFDFMEQYKFNLRFKVSKDLSTKQGFLYNFHGDNQHHLYPRDRLAVCNVFQVQTDIIFNKKPRIFIEFYEEDCPEWK